jgi:hypothetical protein
MDWPLLPLDLIAAMLKDYTDLGDPAGPALHRALRLTCKGLLNRVPKLPPRLNVNLRFTLSVNRLVRDERVEDVGRMLGYTDEEARQQWDCELQFLRGRACLSYWHAAPRYATFDSDDGSPWWYWPWSRPESLRPCLMCGLRNREKIEHDETLGWKFSNDYHRLCAQCTDEMDENDYYAGGEGKYWWDFE